MVKIRKIYIVVHIRTVISEKMTKVYVLDVFETLADTPGWTQLVESDPKLKELAEKAKSD